MTRAGPLAERSADRGAHPPLAVVEQLHELQLRPVTEALHGLAQGATPARLAPRCASRSPPPFLRSPRRAFDESLDRLGHERGPVGSPPRRSSWRRAASNRGDAAHVGVVRTIRDPPDQAGATRRSRARRSVTSLRCVPPANGSLRTTSSSELARLAPPRKSMATRADAGIDRDARGCTPPYEQLARRGEQRRRAVGALLDLRARRGAVAAPRPSRRSRSQAPRGSAGRPGQARSITHAPIGSARAPPVGDPRRAVGLGGHRRPRDRVPRGPGRRQALDGQRRRPGRSGGLRSPRPDVRAGRTPFRRSCPYGTSPTQAQWPSARQWARDSTHGSGSRATRISTVVGPDDPRARLEARVARRRARRARGVRRHDRTTSSWRSEHSCPCGQDAGASGTITVASRARLRPSRAMVHAAESDEAWYAGRDPGRPTPVAPRHLGVDDTARPVAAASTGLPMPRARAAAPGRRQRAEAWQPRPRRYATEHDVGVRHPSRRARRGRNRPGRGGPALSGPTARRRPGRPVRSILPGADRVHREAGQPDRVAAHDQRRRRLGHAVAYEAHVSARAAHVEAHGVGVPSAAAIAAAARTPAAGPDRSSAAGARCRRRSARGRPTTSSPTPRTRSARRRADTASRAAGARRPPPSSRSARTPGTPARPRASTDDQPVVTPRSAALRTCCSCVPSRSAWRRHTATASSSPRSSAASSSAGSTASHGSRTPPARRGDRRPRSGGVAARARAVGRRAGRTAMAAPGVRSRSRQRTAGRDQRDARRPALQYCVRRHGRPVREGAWRTPASTSPPRRPGAAVEGPCVPPRRRSPGR